MFSDELSVVGKELLDRSFRELVVISISFRMRRGEVLSFAEFELVDIMVLRPVASVRLPTSEQKAYEFQVEPSLPVPIGMIERGSLRSPSLQKRSGGNKRFPRLLVLLLDFGHSDQLLRSAALLNSELSERDSRVETSASLATVSALFPFISERSGSSEDATDNSGSIDCGDPENVVRCQSVNSQIRLRDEIPTLRSSGSFILTQRGGLLSVAGDTKAQTQGRNVDDGGVSGSRSTLHAKLIRVSGTVEEESNEAQEVLSGGTVSSGLLELQLKKEQRKSINSRSRRLKSREATWSGITDLP